MNNSRGRKLMYPSAGLTATCLSHGRSRILFWNLPVAVDENWYSIFIWFIRPSLSIPAASLNSITLFVFLVGASVFSVRQGLKFYMKFRRPLIFEWLTRFLVSCTAVSNASSYGGAHCFEYLLQRSRFGTISYARSQSCRSRLLALLMAVCRSLRTIRLPLDTFSCNFILGF